MRSHLIIILSLVLVTFFSLGMLVTISQYTSLQTNVGFLNQKQEYISNSFWLIAFYIHVFSCFFCLFAGITQFSKYILKHQRELHRFLGKLYIGNVFFINAPVGLVLAIYANGGIISKSAFVVLDILWFGFTLIAYREAKKKNIIKHREFMIRSYAHTFSAITFRLLKPFLTATTSLNTEIIYMIDSWLAFCLNMLIAELIIYSSRKIRLSLETEVVNNK